MFPIKKNLYTILLVGKEQKMDQKKIGDFIAQCRKEKKMTQSELAERLGVTNRSISNWENARCMPDLSLFKPLCDILDIKVGELLEGEKIKPEDYPKKGEINIIKTIDYSCEKIEKSEKKMGITIGIIGLVLVIAALCVVPSESSWSSIYSIVGLIIMTIGIAKSIKKKSTAKKIIISIIFFITSLSLLIIFDFIAVSEYDRPPRYAYLIESGDDEIIYRAIFYDVYRINPNTKNEYYWIDLFKTSRDIPRSPFNRKKSGVDNIVKYKNSYVGDNSNMGNLISALPLSEYGYVFEIDSAKRALTIDYHITSWLIEENDYLKKSLVYDAVSLFLLIENLSEIKFNFSGSSYEISRAKIESGFPNYDKIENDIKKDFDKYVETKINDDDFVETTFRNIFLSS